MGVKKLKALIKYANMTEKACTACGVVKPVSEYTWYTIENVRRPMPKCKPCHSAYTTGLIKKVRKDKKSPQYAKLAKRQRIYSKRWLDKQKADPVLWARQQERLKMYNATKRAQNAAIREAHRQELLNNPAIQALLNKIKQL